jgi:hypothetical protein
LVLYVPGITIAVYSTGRRASEMLKEQVEQFVEMTGPENKARIIVSNQEKLFISHDLFGEVLMDGSTTRKKHEHTASERKSMLTAKLHSYPTSKKGKGEKIITTTISTTGIRIQTKTTNKYSEIQAEFRLTVSSSDTATTPRTDRPAR